jgi:hypothetical protein
MILISNFYKTFSMIDPRYLLSAAQPPLTDEQKNLLNGRIQKQLRDTYFHKPIPLENYPIRATTKSEVIFELEKWLYQALFLLTAFFWGLAWRLEHEGLFWGACVTSSIMPFQYHNANWYVKVSARSITIRTDANRLLEIPFQQIICIYLEEQRELVIYHAYHGGDYAVTRTTKLGEINDTMGLIHYFFNQYKNSLPTP